MNIILTIIGLLCIGIFGWVIVNLLLVGISLIEKMSLSFIVGSGVFTFIWFLLNWLGLPYNLLSSSLILCLPVSVFLFKFKFSSKKISLPSLKNFDIVEKIMIITIVFIVLSAIFQTVYWPIRYWDSMVLYDFRARIFAQTGFMQDAISRGNFFGYPLLTSLMHTFIYLFGLTNPLFYYSLLYLCLIIIFFENVKKFNLGRPTSLFLTLLVAVSPRFFDHTQWGYTNLPYSIYIILGSIYFYWGIKNKNLGSFVISSILIGLSTWTRTAEPFWLSYIILSVIFSILVKKWFWPLIYSFVVGAFMFPWRIYMSLFNEGEVNVVSQVVNTSVEVARNIFTSLIVPVLGYIFVNVIYQYLEYFILFVIILIFKISIKSKNWIFVSIFVLNLTLTFAGTLIFAKFTDYWNEIPDSLSRMVMFMPVMILFLAGELLSEIKKR